MAIVKPHLFQETCLALVNTYSTAYPCLTVQVLDKQYLQYSLPLSDSTGSRQAILEIRKL